MSTVETVAETRLQGFWPSYEQPAADIRRTSRSRAFPTPSLQNHPFVGKRAWYFWAARFQVLATVGPIGFLGKLGSWAGRSTS